jgi:hypothetical protein
LTHENLHKPGIQKPMLQKAGPSSCVHLEDPKDHALIAKLILHRSTPVAEAITEVAVAIMRCKKMAALLARMPTMTNLCAQLERVMNHSGAPHSLKALAVLHNAVLAAMGQLIMLDEDSAGIAVEHLRDLVRAVRWEDARTRFLACANISLLTEPHHHALLTRVDAVSLALPLPFGQGSCSHGAAALAATADGPSTSGGHEAAAGGPGHDVALRLRSLILPVLVHLLEENEELSRQVPRIMERVISKDSDLQRAVADSSALNHLAATIVAKVRAPVAAVSQMLLESLGLAFP